MSIIYHSPIPCRAKKAKIREFAEKTRNEAGLKNGFQLPELVKVNYGALIYKDFLDGGHEDAIRVNPDGSFQVSLSAHTGALRDSFTIAHELGHFLLHWPLVQEKFPGGGMKATRRIDYTDEAVMRCDWEANWFAAAFLMPQKEFEGLYERGVAAEALGVTPAAVKARAASLGLIEVAPA